MFKGLSRVIKILILFDLVLVFGWGLVAPILAVFITEQIKGGDVKIAGIAVGIYWFFKSLFQIPISRYLDKNHGEKDDYYALIGGTLLISLVPLGFIFAVLPWHMYLLQFIYAIGGAFAYPAWYGIFSRHVSKGKEAQSWSLDSSAWGMGAGTAGIIGGIVAKIFGFTPLFVVVSVLGVAAAFLCLFIKKDLSRAPKDKIVLVPKPKITPQPPYIGRKD